MFKKVLIAEDLGWNTKKIEQQLFEKGAEEIVITEYCDDAHLKFLKALKDENPFDLLIADLSFEQDHREQTLKGGSDLIAKIREYPTSIKIIVFSMEERLQKIRSLFEEQNIDAYVFKSRTSLEDLSNALEAVKHNKRFISPQVAAALDKRQSLDIENYDILLLKKLSDGCSNKEISDEFKKNAIRPSSISSIEKRLNRLRILFKANNAVHLVAVVKDLGLI
ncbi:response regulator [Leeuwenhoekiella sp. A16]|uniref:response regulator n=1 Tax=unclassified Leeuwenhoekiella TaxID=2615029 RepID=UPI003A80F95E